MGKCEIVWGVMVERGGWLNVGGERIIIVIGDDDDEL